MRDKEVGYGKKVAEIECGSLVRALQMLNVQIDLFNSTLRSLLEKTEQSSK